MLSRLSTLLGCVLLAGACGMVEIIETAPQEKNDRNGTKGDETETESGISSVGLKSDCSFISTNVDGVNANDIAVGCLLLDNDGVAYEGAIDNLKVVSIDNSGTSSVLTHSQEAIDDWQFYFVIPVEDFSVVSDVIVTLKAKEERVFFAVELAFSGEASILTFAQGLSYDFGDAVVGETVSKELQVIYLGNADARVTGVAALGSDFSFKGGSYPGTGGTCGTTISGNCTVVVNFAPTAVTVFGASSRTEQIAIAYDNGVADRYLYLDISGDGVYGAVGLFGQSSYSGSAAGSGSTGVNAPSGSTICNDGSNDYLFVADAENHRVLAWQGVPSDFSTPDFVLGQADLSGSSANRGGSTGLGTMNRPVDVHCDGTSLVVADQLNNRVLFWSSVPTSTTDATYAMGQTSGTGNGQVAASQNRLRLPGGVHVDGSSIYVADKGNHRVLIWTSLPTGHGANANYVLGQANFTASDSSAATASTTLYSPERVTSDGTRLFVSDGANRVLIWNTVPSANQTAANVVLGQSAMTGSAANASGLAASSLNSPSAITVHSGSLYVADKLNNRVLVWDSIPSSDGEDADQVIGQDSFKVAAANRGKATNERGLERPSGLVLNTASGDTSLFISDFTNNRVLRVEIP